MIDETLIARFKSSLVTMVQQSQAVFIGNQNNQITHRLSSKSKKYLLCYFALFFKQCYAFINSPVQAKLTTFVSYFPFIF